MSRRTTAATGSTDRTSGDPYLHREEQARRELGTTRVRPGVAAALSGALLGVLVTVPLFEVAGPGRERLTGRLAALGRSAVSAVRQAADGEPFAANRQLLGAMHRYEEAGEQESWIAEELLPAAQAVLTGALRAGGEEVVAGRGGWLFYRPAVSHLTGPAFLAPDALAARRFGAGAEPLRHADPRPALAELAREVGRRGARLVVLPVPVKAAVHPERLAAGAGPPPLANPSTARLLAELAASGIAVLDPAPLLAAAASAGRPQFLATDSHWSPAAVETTAARLATLLREIDPGLGPPGPWRRERAEVRGIGDLARVLRLPPVLASFAPQRVVVHRVLSPAGEPWRPQPGAPVLLLGDSFSNVFSAPRLGWGGGAGLAEQLAWSLGLPVDRLAVDAGGAWASRSALVRRLAADPAALTGTRVVVYQFAARELSHGDWRPFQWPEP